MHKDFLFPTIELFFLEFLEFKGLRMQAKKLDVVNDHL